MPRPNPPRKRPRKRPDAQTRAARADAALTKQTAQSTQPKQAPSSKPPEPTRGGAAAAPAMPELWSRRSYAVLIAIIAILQVPISTIEWAAEPAATRGPLYLTLIALNPISLLIASLFAVPIAKFITREQRTLKFVESLVVGLIIFAIWFFLFTVVATAISTPVAAGGTSNCGATSGVATPIPASATASASSATPCPSPSASLAPTPSSSPSPNGSSAASPSASANASGTAPASTIENTPRNYAALAATNLAAFVLSVYVYPPVYRRFRFRPRPPSTASRGGQRNPRDKKK